MDGKIKLRADHLCKTYFTKKRDFDAVADISLEVKENEFLVLLGPGQCGKSVFLNMVSGLEKPTLGEIYIDDERADGTSDKISMVFQRMAVMPWKTSMENTEMGPRYHHINKRERRKTAQGFLNMVGLEGFEKSYPRQLSGGMKQRVGIARAYTAASEILLMDEPFGALDAQTRYAMQDEILKIWENNKRTIIFVTNNIEEAIYLGDRIVLLTKRPAMVKKEYDLSGLPRPRNNVSRVFMDIRREITENMDLGLE